MVERLKQWNYNSDTGRVTNPANEVISSNLICPFYKCTVFEINEKTDVKNNLLGSFYWWEKKPIKITQGKYIESKIDKITRTHVQVYQAATIEPDIEPLAILGLLEEIDKSKDAAK